MDQAPEFSTKENRGMATLARTGRPTGVRAPHRRTVRQALSTQHAAVSGFP